MPVAVVQGEPDRFELKTCPGGFVSVRRMSYGEKLERRKFTSKMEVLAQRGSKDARSIVDIFKEETDLYDFAHCVVGHNLTDVDGRPLVFRNPEDVRKLAGQIAEEIGTYIDKVNNFEDSDDVGNSSGASAPTS